VRFLAVVRFPAVLSAGLVAGVFLGDRMGASFARRALSSSSFVTFQQIQHAHFVKMMPTLIGIAILASVAWLVLIRARMGSAEFLFLALGTLATISVIVLTRAVNVPINNQLMTWNASSPPPDVMGIWARWEQAHNVRTVLAVLGFALELAAFGASENVAAT
jgi:UDP-N-acetylmuramyl pentapeptide phosphotransferase/UDP-N-acetylglucosamine-1-phosphate transferase